jgi:hypothetical protein
MLLRARPPQLLLSLGAALLFDDLVPEMPGERDGAETSEEPLDGEVLEPNFRPGSKHPPLDIGAVIADALKKAGLLKSG